MIMKKSMKKSILSYITVGVLSLSIFSGTSALAAENNNAEPVNPVRVSVPEQNVLVSPSSILVNSSIESNTEVAPASLPSYITKKGIKWALKNTTTITNKIGNMFGDRAAVVAGNVMNDYVKPVLKQLEAFDKVTYGKLEEVLIDALQGPLGETAGTICARGITEVIAILAPI